MIEIHCPLYYENYIRDQAQGGLEGTSKLQKEVAHTGQQYRSPILLHCCLSFILHVWLNGSSQVMEEQNLKPGSWIDPLVTLALVENGLSLYY